LTYVDGQVTFALSPLIRGISLARKILLADDSVTAQNMGRKILADAGYEVIAVNNGSAALKKIAELKPDLVILDVYMPGYSGLEVCQRLKESQETARIPVLLSVGKLEPFKPEESQRVRADGYIVKPFEASELLSALSKLEDKVVPRAEPSKPGRFARAIAAAEESGRGNRNEPAGEENGWKSRIGFPKAKAEPEAKVADEASIYNPLNKDLRTVVETSAEKASEKKEDTAAAPAAEPAVDVAALAPAGLPKDVTPEEVAAIAAAAAQIQMATAAIKDDQQAPETTSQVSAEPVPAPVEAGSKTDALAENKIDSSDEAAAAPAANVYQHSEQDDKNKPDAPVTIAATAESVISSSAAGSRWTAVSVALEAEESTISLDQEMQKAYVAFSASEPVTPAAVPEVQSSATENSSSPAEVEAPAAISSPAPAPEPEPVVSAVAQESVPAPVEQIEAPAEPVSLSEPAVSAPAIAESVPVELPAATAEFSQPNLEPAPVAEYVSPVAETETVDAAAPVAQDLQPVPEAESATPEAEMVSAVTPATPRVEGEPEPPAEPKLDSETVKSTAAAWASWRQTRDISKDDTTAAEAEAKETAIDEPAPAEATARAVAAGAEQTMQEAIAGTLPEAENPSDVASIVDSVLADLRPKLMEEINRKMSKKK
jgi:CheY-like chemotaxis protein